MSIFSTSYLQKLVDRGHQDLSRATGGVFQRLPITSVVGTSIYDLPTNVHGVHSVWWKGFRLEPLNLSELSPSELDDTGRPSHYLFHHLGPAKIQLFPKPNEVLTANTATYNTVAGIKQQFIVHYFAIADGDTLQMPAYLTRTTLKWRALARAYRMESPAQNLRAASFFDNFANFLEGKYREILGQPLKQMQRQLQPSNSSPSRSKGRGSLPSTGAWSF